MLDTITRFEVLVGDVLGRSGGRLVKLIGDGAMFVVDEPEQACRLVLDLVDTFESDRSVPPIRVALTYGTVVASNGDYYGDVVNLAARLVAVADPGTVVATAEVIEAAGPSASAEQLPARANEGLPRTGDRLPNHPVLTQRSEPKGLARRRLRSDPDRSRPPVNPRRSPARVREHPRAPATACSAPQWYVRFMVRAADGT